MTQDEIIKELAKLPSDKVKAATEAAQKLRAETLRSKVPESEIKRLKALYTLFNEGEVQTDKVTLNLKLTTKIAANYGWDFGHLEDAKLELADTSRRHTELETRLFEKIIGPDFTDVRLNDSTIIENVLPSSQERCDKATASLTAFREARDQFEERYGFDPLPLVEG